MEKASRNIENEQLTAIKSFVKSTGFNVNWVQMHLTSLCAMPRVLPSITLWDIPNKNMNIAEFVYQLLMTDNYIDEIWPILKILLGTSIGNESWTVAVATTVALFDCLKVLPHIPSAERGD